MTTRILPQGEWDRIAHLEIGQALPFHHPHDVTVIVVEDGEQIVGAWAVLRVVQLEGVWIEGRYRKSGSVAKRLLEKTMDVARAQAMCFAFTGSQSPEVSNLLTEHLGAQRLPMESFVIPLRELVCR